MSSDNRINPQSQVAPIKEVNFDKTAAVKEKLAQIPEQVNGQVQGRTIATFFGTAFAAIEQKINRLAENFITPFLADPVKTLDAISAKILTEIPQKFFDISASILPSKTSEIQKPKPVKVDVPTFQKQIGEIAKTLTELSNAVLLKGPEVGQIKEKLEKQVQSAKLMRTEDKGLREPMQAALKAAQPFLEKADMNSAAMDYKRGNNFIKDLGNFNIAIFGGNVLVDNKLELNSLKSWYLNNIVLGRYNQDNKEAFTELNLKIEDLVKFCTESHSVFGSFIQKNAEDKRGFSTSIPLPKGNLTPADIQAKLKEARSSIQTAIDQVKKMTQELDEISFVKTGSGQEFAVIGDHTKEYLRANCNKLLRNLEAIKAQVTPPPQRS